MEYKVSNTGDDWRKLPLSEEEHRVFLALADPKWDFRTIKGIARSSDLTQAQIIEVLTKYQDYIYESVTPDAEGNPLFTLKERKSSKYDFWNSIRTFVSKSLD